MSRIKSNFFDVFMLFFTLRASEESEPGAAWAGCRDTDQMFGLRLELAGALIDGSLPDTAGTEREDFGTVIVSDVGNCEGILVDIPADLEGARLRHG